MNQALSQFDYPQTVLGRFQYPHHVGSLPPETGVVRARAGSRERGASVELWLQAADSRIGRARFQAYGCPHFIAAAEMLCEWCEGRTLEELPKWSWQAIQSELAIPASKRGKLLILDSVLKTAIETLLSTQVPAS